MVCEIKKVAHHIFVQKEGRMEYLTLNELTKRKLEETYVVV